MLVLQYQLGSGLIAIRTLALEIYFQEFFMILKLIALTKLLPKALNAFSRFHSVVIHLMLPLLLTYLNIRTRWDINQLCHPMHLPSGMLKKLVMPSHLKEPCSSSGRSNFVQCCSSRLLQTDFPNKLGGYWLFG